MVCRDFRCSRLKTSSMPLQHLELPCFVQSAGIFRILRRFTHTYRNLNTLCPLSSSPGIVSCKIHPGSNEGSYLEREIAAARREKRPYRIDKSKLNDRDRQLLRLRSRAIPLVADSDPLEIVYEDEVFLVVSKPSFVKMHPSHRFEGGSLLNRAIGYLGYEPRILHRLDMVQKSYLCVVDGICPEDIETSFTIDEPIQRHGVSFVREVGDSQPDSKPACTEFTIFDKSPVADMMLLRASPKTGRTHQIRVHARHCGLPIVGDDLYNPKEHDMYESLHEISFAARNSGLQKYADGNPLRRGLKLHAWKISLVNPLSRQLMSFCAPMPNHMLQLIDYAGMALQTREKF